MSLPGPGEARGPVEAGAESSPTVNESESPVSTALHSVFAQPTRPAVYGPVRTVVWQGSAGDRRPYADRGGAEAFRVKKMIGSGRNCEATKFPCLCASGVGLPEESCPAKVTASDTPAQLKKAPSVSARLVGVVAVCLLGLNALTAEAQTNWRGMRSENYRFVGDADEEDFREIAARLEGFYAAVLQFFRGGRFRPPSPTTVIVLEDDDELRDLGLTENDGYFFADSLNNYIVLAPETRSRRPFEKILHDYFHAIARENIPNVPLWLVEGLADFYRTVEWSSEEEELQLGLSLDAYVGLVRDDRSRISFEELSAVDINSEIYDESDREGIFYAQSWAFVHYLITRNEGLGFSETASFVQLMAAGNSFEEAVQEAFGVGFRVLLGDFENHVRQRRTYSYLTMSIPDSSREVVSVDANDISPVQAQTYLAELLILAGFPGEAENLLGRALRLDRSSALPFTVLGRLLIDQRRFGEAQLSLEFAMDASDADHLSHFYYALSLLREDPEQIAERLGRARRALREAIQISPGFAASYHELAVSYLGTGENLNEAVQLLNTALERSPGNPDYLVTLSRILIDQGRFDTARTILLPLIAETRDAETRGRAESIMRSIEGQTENPGLRGEGFTEITSTSTEPDAPESRASRGPPAPRVANDRFQLSRIVSGEQQEGLLSLIDCRDGLTLTVEGDSGTYMFHTGSPDRVEFASYRSDVGSEIGCGPVDPPLRVVITFQPAPEESEFVGVPEKIEFVRGP